MAAKLTKLTHRIAISDTTAPNCRELYYLQFSLQAASPETFGYTLVLLPERSLHRTTDMKYPGKPLPTHINNS